MKIKKEAFPYILMIAFIAFIILGIFLGFTPSH
jgi:hypothetical protein